MEAVVGPDDHQEDRSPENVVQVPEHITYAALPRSHGAASSNWREIFSFTDPESGYGVLSNSVIQSSSQHTRVVSGSTLLNSVDAPSQILPLPEESFQRTVIPTIEEEVPIQSPEIQQSNPHAVTTTTGILTSRGLLAESEAPEPDEAVSPGEVDGRSSNPGNGEAAWETVIEMIEKRHENDVADLREEHKLEMDERRQDIERLERHLRKANQRNERTQMRVNGLLQGHTELKSQVNASEETLQQAIAASQALQARYDELKEQYEKSKIVAQENPLQGPSSQPSQQDTKADVEHMDDDTVQLRQAFRVMAADLNQAHAENRLRFAENHDLKRALRQHPERDPGLHKVVAYQDKLLCDIQTRASECSMALEKLQIESTTNNEIANAEITKLRTQLSEKCFSIAHLQSSVQIFKAQSEKILAMLKAKVYPNDLIQAMDGYFQTAIKDNQVLAAGGKRQADLIDEMHEITSILRADLLQAKRSSDEKDDLCEQLKRDMRERENEVGGLQVKSEALEHDLEKAVQEKDEKIAELEREMITVVENVQTMMNSTLDERIWQYVGLKEQETARATANCRAIFSENWELQHRLHDLQQEEDFQKCLVYFKDQNHQQVEARLREAEEELGFLRDENQLQRKLPPTINITTVLAEREELEAARLRIRNLEQALQAENSVTEEGALRKAVDSILSLKLLGFRMLVQIARMNNAVKVRENRDDFDEVDAYVAECEERLNAVETYDDSDSDDIAADEPQESEEAEDAAVVKGDANLQDSVNLTPTQWARKYPPE